MPDFNLPRPPPGDRSRYRSGWREAPVSSPVSSVSSVSSVRHRERFPRQFINEREVRRIWLACLSSRAPASEPGSGAR